MHRQVVGCEPHGQMMGGMGMVGAVRGVGIMGAVGCPRLTYSAIADNPKGDKLEKDDGRCGGSGGVRAARSDGGSCGSCGRGEKGKTLSEFGDFDKVYYFLKLIFNDINISLTPISEYYILILHSLLYHFL